MDKRRVVVDAPAKVNLSLELLGTRADGYHLLRSVLMPVSLYETVTAEEADAITCETAGDGVDVSELSTLPQERHLAVRAAEALRAAAGVRAGARIHISKRVPIGAGMGGGSADAAGVLTALNELWGLRWPAARLAEVGATLGSDVPAMTLGGAVLLEGAGERVRRILAPDEHPAGFWLVAVFPGIPVSTKKIYENGPSLLTSAPCLCDNLVAFVRSGDVHGASRCLFNGLERTAFALYPQTERFGLALRAAGALSCLLSGSGSAVFGLAESERHADEVRRRVESRLGAGHWTRIMITLPDGVMAAHGPLVP